MLRTAAVHSVACALCAAHLPNVLASAHAAVPKSLRLSFWVSSTQLSDREVVFELLSAALWLIIYFGIFIN